MRRCQIADGLEMKRTLRILGGVILLASVIVWAALGAHRGWTKTRVEIKTMDDVTGIEKREWQDKFLPGVDFLGAGVLADRKSVV